jgi:hypothetical protein
VKLFNVMVHVLTETTRHAGHADILRGQLDGTSGPGPQGTPLHGHDAAYWEPEATAMEGLDDFDEDLLAQEDPDAGAAERAELVELVRKLADVNNRAFTAAELAEIRRESEALHAEVRTLTELNRDQREAIEKLLAQVQHGSERMGRKDWFTYAIGAATSLVIMEIVPPLALLPPAAHAIHALAHLLTEA